MDRAKKTVQKWLRRERANYEMDAPPEEDTDMSMWVPPRATKPRPVDERDAVPARLKKRFEAEQIVRALKASTRMNNQDEFDEGLQDSHDYVSYVRGIPEDEWYQVKKEDNPSTRTLHRSQLKVDSVATLFERREWELIVKSPDKLESLHIFADGSPVVGHELQGMVVDMAF